MLKGLECVMSVEVAVDGATVASLNDRDCAFLTYAVARMPPATALATRVALADCVTARTRR